MTVLVTQASECTFSLKRGVGDWEGTERSCFLEETTSVGGTV